MVTKRYGKANHPKIPGYDSSKPTVHILDLDANNLYGVARGFSISTNPMGLCSLLDWVQGNLAQVNEASTALTAHRWWNSLC